MAIRKAPTKNFLSTVLNGGINDSVQTITLASTANLQAPGAIVVDRVDANGVSLPNSREVIEYLVINGNDLEQCVRGADNSTARSHSDGALVETNVTVGTFNSLISAILTVADSNGYLSPLASPASLAIIQNTTLLNTSIASIARLQIAQLAVSSVASIANLKALFPSGASVGIVEFAIGNSDGHIAIRPGANKFVKVAVLRQDGTSSPANSYANNQVILTGWGFIAGDGDTSNAKTVTFGITFDAAPVVVVGALGRNTSSDPTAIGDLNAVGDELMTGSNITTSQITVTFSNVSGNNIASSVRCGFSWIAIGTLN